MKDSQELKQNKSQRKTSWNKNYRNQCLNVNQWNMRFYIESSISLKTAKCEPAYLGHNDFTGLQKWLVDSLLSMSCSSVMKNSLCGVEENSWCHHISGWQMKVEYTWRHSGSAWGIWHSQSVWFFRNQIETSIFPSRNPPELDRNA